MAIKPLPKVLVLTLYCGEPQYEQCCSSVKSQLGVNCDQIVIANKPNYEAHLELYRHIESAKKKYDFFIKLDADMIFSRQNSVSSLLEFFTNETDYVTIPVFDFFVKEDIPALHIFRNTVSFNFERMTALHPDYVQVDYPGKSMNVLSSNELVFHCFEPNEKQCFLYGAHRALKILQRDKELEVISSFSHFLTLRKVFVRYENLEDMKELSKVLQGFSYVFSNKSLKTMVKKHDFVPSNELLHNNDFNLGMGRPTILFYMKIVGFKRILKSTSILFFRKLNKLMLSKFIKFNFFKRKYKW